MERGQKRAKRFEEPRKDRGHRAAKEVEIARRRFARPAPAIALGSAIEAQKRFQRRNGEAAAGTDSGLRHEFDSFAKVAREKAAEFVGSRTDEDEIGAGFKGQKTRFRGHGYESFAPAAVRRFASTDR